jgi:DNA-directed RNA polymerase specialized sigma24 family protein
VLLHWYEGLSFPEIARILRASESAVKVRAHRAYQRLREFLAGPDRMEG